MLILHKSLPFYLFFLAFLLRLVFLLGFYQDKEQVPYFEDVGIAINLLHGMGYAYNFSMIIPELTVRPTAAKPPMYPLLVSLVFFLFGMKNFFALFAIHAFLSSLTCLLLFLTVAKFSYNTAVIAGLACAIYPPFIHHAISIPESTTLLMLFISLFCYGLVSLREHFTQSRWIILCFTSGFLAMTEPITIPFIFFSCFYIAYIIFSSWKKISIEMLIVCFIFVATVAPWTIRNYFIFNDLVLLKSNFGSSLKDSMYRSGIRLPITINRALREQVQGVDEVSEDKAVKKAMLSWIAANPLMYLRLLPKNFLHFWWETENYKMDYTAKYIFGRKLPYILLLILSVPAMLWRLIQLGKNLKLSLHMNVYQNMMLMLICMYTVAYTIIGALLIRYHFPVELGMFVFFAETVLYAINKIHIPYQNLNVSRT